MFLFGHPGIFPSGRISNIDATCESTVSACLYFDVGFFLTPSVLCGVEVRTMSPFIQKAKWVNRLVVSRYVMLYMGVGYFSWWYHCCIYRSHLILWYKEGELVFHSTSPEFLYAAVAHGSAGRKQPRWDLQALAVLCWNEWLSREQSVAIRLLKGQEGDIHFTGAERIQCWFASHACALCVVAAFSLGFMRIQEVHSVPSGDE